MTYLGLSPDSANTEIGLVSETGEIRALHTHTHNKVLCGTKATLLSQLNCLPIGFLQSKSHNSDSQDWGVLRRLFFNRILPNSNQDQHIIWKLQTGHWRSRRWKGAHLFRINKKDHDSSLMPWNSKSGTRRGTSCIEESLTRGGTTSWWYFPLITCRTRSH